MPTITGYRQPGGNWETYPTQIDFASQQEFDAYLKRGWPTEYRTTEWAPPEPVFMPMPVAHAPAPNPPSETREDKGATAAANKAIEWARESLLEPLFAVLNPPPVRPVYAPAPNPPSETRGEVPKSLETPSHPMARDEVLKPTYLDQIPARIPQAAAPNPPSGEILEPLTVSIGGGPPVAYAAAPPTVGSSYVPPKTVGLHGETDDTNNLGSWTTEQVRYVCNLGNPIACAELARRQSLPDQTVLTGPTFPTTPTSPVATPPINQTPTMANPDGTTTADPSTTPTGATDEQGFDWLIKNREKVLGLIGGVADLIDPKESTAPPPTAKPAGASPDVPWYKRVPWWAWLVPVAGAAYIAKQKRLF